MKSWKEFFQVIKKSRKRLIKAFEEYAKENL